MADEVTSTRSHPFHIWLIAGIYLAASAIGVMHDFQGANRLASLARPEGLFVLCLDLLPGLLGILLILGQRWVRWLFLLLVPLVAAVAFLVMFGNAMQGAPKDAPEVTWLWGFFLVSLASTVAVFIYLAPKLET